MATKIAIVYHSGFGHTAQVAKAVQRGAASVPQVEVKLLNVDELKGNFDELTAADGIIFGCPTYMGGASAPFKAFIDACSKIWFQQKWKDKIAAGFTNSGGLSGDKLQTLQALWINAMQHGMVWVGNAQLVSGIGPNDINRLSAYSGVMTQADNAPPEQSPPPGDLKTAENFGVRVAEATKRWLKGRA